MDNGRPLDPFQTLPLRGMRYITSPSVPSVALGNKHLPQLPYTPIVCAEGGSNLLAAIPATCPSASMPLNTSNKDATQTVNVKANDNKKNTRRKSVAGQYVTSKAATIAHNGTLSSTLHTSSRGDTHRSPSLSMLTSHMDNSAKTVTANALMFSKKMGETYSGGRDTVNSTKYRTVSNEALPPLVTVLERYIRREMDATLSRGTPVTAQDRLRPFREAFFAFIDAFPGYGNILNDIISAYDGVIQEQAKLLVETISGQSQHHLAEQHHIAEVAGLKATISNLMAELDEFRNQVKETEMPPSSKDGERIISEPRLQRLAKLSSEKDKELHDAREHIAALGEVIKSDLEKQLVLINALRESDRRAKAMEEQLSAAASQMDELADFKIMAGDAQKQLEEFKLKYENFISVQDHEIIRDYLKGELQAAQHMVRQYRRSAAVRGTQVDVIGRKLKTIQEENKKLIDTVEDERKELLTPRPDWKKIHASLPDLKEIATPFKAITLEGDEAITSTVEGLSETRLQVEYLVESVNSLSRELQQRKMVLKPMSTPTLSLIGQGMDPRVPLHLRACGIIPRVSLDQVEILLLVHDFFSDILQPHPDVLLHTLDVPALYKEFLQERIQTREALQVFVCAEHLAINLADVAKCKENTRPSLRLLDGILSGIFPARIACDVMTIVENVRLELTGLSKGQGKTRLRRVAISDCIAPFLNLKTLAEVVALREAMGSDTTHNVGTLCATEGKFMSTFFDQECASGMAFYVNLLEKLTSYAYCVKPENNELVISLENVGQAITEVEPLTPKVIIKEITENSTEKSVSVEKVTVRLSDVIHLLAAAPLIRRSAQPKSEEGKL
ncbi:hypothetical protein TraAM80_03873 [Trypanosoma rangeli]|uniref:Uncharacterized protein n=1 Tax=Trypanosoma rangeli TaxID=5698 RepID=A0A422NLP7_TRYRA|nr:uncharacterized protein TraAM80_03873 [Trypanosoma rangeli]RNF06407.1 hypothetical protein TraAM80_03873 [Trypanosoma rangeli]|eukprot:RNF06407.1 hypothetical protein TraAM80_03873 [Trypanosoma rangeli]